MSYSSAGPGNIVPFESYALVSLDGGSGVGAYRYDSNLGRQPEAMLESTQTPSAQFAAQRGSAGELTAFAVSAQGHVAMRLGKGSATTPQGPLLLRKIGGGSENISDVAVVDMDYDTAGTLWVGDSGAAVLHLRGDGATTFKHIVLSTAKPGTSEYDARIPRYVRAASNGSVIVVTRGGEVLQFFPL